METIEIFATGFGLACVYLTVRQNIWCWPTGVVMVVLYTIIFYQARLYSDMGLQVIYFFLQFYGWYMWLYGGRDKEELTVSRITQRGIYIWFSVALLCVLTLGYLMNTYTNADLAYPDATTTVLSLVAQILMSKKILECWLVWITVDVLSIGIYGVKELYLTMGLYSVFLGLATAGFFAWRKTLTQEAAPLTAPA